MALARVVSFDGVDSDRMAEMQKEMEGSEQPDDVPAKEIVVLHDPENDRSLVILFFESEDDYRRGHEIPSRVPHDQLDRSFQGRLNPIESQPMTRGWRQLRNRMPTIASVCSPPGRAHPSASRS